MTLTPAEKSQVYWAVTIAITILLSVYSTIYSLTHGIYEVFPFLYFLPIILFVYFYTHRGVILSLI
ncbi:MAG: histidine kinase, partial [Methanoregula sp.]|nr:histidine kinase [Methanoregula sp.]